MYAFPAEEEERFGFENREREYWSDEFHEAVELAFKGILDAGTLAAGLDPKREKLRIREKIRKAGQTCSSGSAKVGTLVDHERMIRDFVQNALERLAQVDPPWLRSFPWVEPFAVFASKVWPNFSSIVGPIRLRRAIKQAVDKWFDGNPPGRPADDRTGREPPGLERQLPSPTIGTAQQEIKRSPNAVDTPPLSTHMQQQPQGPVTVRISSLPHKVSLGVTLQGLCVRKLTPGSIGVQVLNVGDTILGVNGRYVESVEQFLDRLNAARPGPVDLLVQVGSQMAEAEQVSAEVRSSGSASLSPGPHVDGQRQGSIGMTARCSSIILNGEDIGTSRLPRHKHQSFVWEAVEQAIRHYEDLGFDTQTVVRQETTFQNPPPDDLWEKLVQCPALDIARRGTEQSSDRLFMVRLAQAYGCHYVDNTDYGRVSWRTQELLDWVSQHDAALRVEYCFDGYGKFLPLKNLGTAAS